MTSPETPVALALSGGGVRAMAFHLGVLKLLAERQLLERIGRISTVSGGSLLVGLLLHETGMRWPTSADFTSRVHSRLRGRLCDRSMQRDAARQLLHPSSWKFILSRANLLALALRSEWGVTERLSELPCIPEWSINGTTAETGKRFRFKRDSLGDYTLGYAAPGEFPLSSAIAMSAAVPGGFGPLSIDARKFEWRKRRTWEEPAGGALPIRLDHSHLHLYDGGVYDNLGLEPLFDAGRRQSKYPGDLIVASDAGAPLTRGFSLFALNPWRFKRVADIISDQARSLRVRTFSQYLQESTGRGAYLYINTPVTGSEPCPSASYATSFPTTLRKLSGSEFDALNDHGYRVALRVEGQYGLTLSTMPNKSG